MEMEYCDLGLFESYELQEELDSRNDVCALDYVDRGYLDEIVRRFENATWQEKVRIYNLVTDGRR